MTTIQQDSFRSRIHEAIISAQKEPVVCPCCNHSHKVYKRSINSMMAKGLIIALKCHKFRSFHAINFLTSKGAYSGDFTKLRFWGFIEQDETKDGRGGKTNGFWRVTEKGSLFVYQRAAAIKYKHIINDEVVGESGNHFTILQSFKDRFEFTELMNR